MADYTFDTSGDMSDALKITPVKEQTQAMITPSAEETAERHEAENQEAAANDEKIGEIIASGRPVMRKIPDLLTTPTLTGNLNPPEPQEKPEWQKAAEWVVDSARDIWRNLFNENAQVLKDADTYAPMLGVSPQYMVDHPELLEETKKRDTLLTINDFLPGNNWYSPETLDKYYPELAKFRQENPVGAALALRNHRDLNDTRSIFERIGDAFNSAGELFADAFNSASDMVKLYDAQMKAVNGEDLDTVKPEVDEITQRLKAYQEEDRPTSALGKIIYDTVQQLTIYGTHGLRALQYVPKGMAMAMATAAPAAAAAGPETLGAGSAAILAAAGATGAAWGLRTGLYNEISKQSMADRYWQMAQQQSNGKPLYSRANMLADSAVVGALNGAVELGLLEFGYGPIKAAFGKDAAKSLLTNAAAQRDVINQGKLALAKIAAIAGAKQYARGTLSELTEEGVQSVIGDVATNVEYGIHHKGRWNTVGDVLNNAVDAMVEAVPAALGMGAMGTGMHTAGHYNAMRNIASLKVDAWREEYQRNVEKQMITDLVANKSDNKLATDSPSTYQTVIQSQAEQHDMGTIYTDAQELARTPEGVNVLNDLVKRDIVTPEQVDTAVQNGTDLEIKTGVFAQRADESFDTDTLMDASTMNQGGTHLAALRERKQRMDALAQDLRDIANDKSDAISEEIMQEHFQDADAIEQDAARDVVYRNPYDLQSSYKEVLKDARKQYEDAVNFKYYWTYKPQGVSIIVADTDGHDNVQTGRGYRMSNNEPWYSDMYKEYGGKATKDQMLDVAYKNERAELAASSPELLPQWDANVEAAKQRYETLRDMGEKFEELSHSDYALRKTFSKEGAAVYQDAVKTFQQGNQAVSQAAKENAYIYARMAERWAQIRRDYGDTAYTAKDFAAAHPIHIGGTGSDVQFGQPITNMTINLDAPAPIITIKEKYAGMDWRNLRRKLPGTVEDDIVSKKNDKGEYIPYVNKATGNKVIVTKKSVDHFKTDHTSNAAATKNRQNTLHYEMIEAIPDIIRKGIWVEAHMDSHGKVEQVIRVLAPVKLNQKIYTVKVTVKRVKNKYVVINGDYTQLTVYDVATKKEPVIDRTSQKSASIETGYLGPKTSITDSNLSIRDFLQNVNDNLGKPYINSDGTPNYGIYFGDNKTGGVMYINPDKFEQRAWHGSGVDFDNFDLGKIGSGTGTSMHGWGIYAAKSKRTAQKYKKEMKDRGLPSVLYEIDVPANKELLDEDKRYKDQMKGVQTKILKAVESLSMEQKQAFWTKWLRQAMGSTKDEIQAETALRQVELNIKHCHDASMGWEGFPAFRKRIALDSLKKQGYTDEQINDTSYMESESKRWEKELSEAKQQSKEAKGAGDKKRNQLIEAAMENPEATLEKGIGTGKEIYNYLTDALSDGKDIEKTSKYLNEQGIHGITYDDAYDGRCYVVFDDKAIQIIDKYNQAYRQGKIRGAFDANTGAIHLFDAADQSSFIHESAHMYLTEMERMVQEEGAPKQLVEDWHTIQDWASYADGRLDDYKGTRLEKEFAGYEAAIRKARESGDTVAIKAAEERWMQERFARAFERYIAEGKAPVKELQGPFRRFKKWLIGIYRDLRNLGKEPTNDVRRAMDRMVASDDEIETWARIRELDAWNRKGFSGDLSGSEGMMIHKWAEKIKEQAKEKLLVQYEEEARQRDAADRQQGLEEERLAYQKQLCTENPIYQYENIYNNMPEARAGILAKLGYADDAEFKQALKAAGGSLEERTDQYVESIRKTYEEDMAMTPDMIRAEADEMLASTNGQMALNQLEAAAMRRKMNGYIAECVKALREVGSVSGTDAEIAAQLRKILGVEYDKNEAQKGALKDSILTKNQQIKDLKKRLAEKDEKAAATKDENDHTIKELKDSLNDVIHGLNQARDMVQGSDMAMLRLAHEEMDAMKVSEATTWRHYEIKAKAASHRADQYMSAGSFEQAVMEKANAQKFYAMARAAKDNADYIRRAMAGESGSLDMNGQEIYGIKGILKQLGRTDKPVRMGPHARYFIQHLAYNLGMTDRDGRPPLDKDGNPAPLNWDYIYRDLSPDYATGQNTAPKQDDLVASWIRAIVDGKDRIQYDKDLTMAQFRDINEAIRAINKVSRRDYEANTLTNTDGSVIAISDAAARLAQSLPHRENWDAEQDRNDQDRKDRGKERLSDALLSLTKIETLLRNMGNDWMQFIYKPVDRACRRELTMQQEACREFARIYHMYSNTEWRKMRSQKLYAVGSVERFTKEQLLVMALNWGNQEGRQRVLDEANRHVKNEAQKANEATIEDIFSRALSNKDLDFLEAVWGQLEQYWPERNKVQERLYGSGMGRVRAKPYTINGRKVSGGYYPIVYDPQLTTRTNEMELDDIVKTQLSGSSTMGIGMGSTKKRMKQVKNQILYKSLDVWPSAVNEAIHHICMREAVTDVYKLISHPDVEAAVQENYGMKTYASLKQWAKDCWKTDVQKTDKISRMLENMRRNTTFAVMAYRTSTAVLNGLNILPMMNRIGVWNTVKAMMNFGIGFYKGTSAYNRNRRFVMEHSPFMADRINTIDKDMQQKMRLTMPKNTSRAGQKARIARDALNRYGYFFITETDLMCSLALWKYQYDESLRQQIDAGKTDEKLMRDQALFEADQAVRDVLGSGMVKDQAELQRKNGLVAQITPFYSYCNTVMNALIDAGYKWKSGNRLAMFNAMLYWIVLNSVFEQLYRSAVSGDDLDKLLKKMGVKFMTNTAQGIPVIRDAAEIIGNHMFGLPNYDSSNVLAVSAADELMKASKAAASKNQDATDVARAANRALNRFVGLPDTLTDGFWSLMRFSIFDTDRSLAALANAVIFDRRYKTAKERQQEAKRKANEKKKENKK